MKKIRLACLGIAVSLLAACTTTPRIAAPVVDRTSGGVKPAADAAPAAPRPEGKGYYTVKKGDTLYRIALEFGQSYRDIVAWNNLANANDIKVDQVLRVAPPDGNNLAGGGRRPARSVRHLPALRSSRWARHQHRLPLLPVATRADRAATSAPIPTARWQNWKNRTAQRHRHRLRLHRSSLIPRMQHRRRLKNRRQRHRPHRQSMMTMCRGCGRPKAKW